MKQLLDKLITIIKTTVNRAVLIILNLRHIGSSDINAAGSIKTVHTHTPTAQAIEISRDDLRIIILTIKGIFQNGKIVAVIIPTV